MTATINASTSAGVVTTADTSGILQLQTNGTAALTVDASQNTTIAGTLTTTGVTTFAAGSAAAPAITTTGDTNTGIFFPAADTIAFAEGGAEAMRITSAGNVGIADSAPNYKFNVGTASGVLSLAGAGISLFTSGSLTSNIGGVLNFRPSIGTTASDIFNLSICAYDHSGDSNADGLSINGNDGISFCTGGNSRNERMRIDSSGNVLVGTTTVTTAKLNVVNTGFAISGECTAGANSGVVYFSKRTSNGIQMRFDQSGTVCGDITTSGSTTTYGTSSDYRLKNTIAPMTGALAKVGLLKPVTYKWNLDNSESQGFIAHELQAVVPECVTGEKDAVETYTDEDGNEATRPAYQGIDTSFLVATLTAAIQELKAIVDAQGAEIAALKGATA